jgi:hypothetical protein
MPGVAIYQRPCAVFCPDCAGNARKIASHQIGPPQEIGRFLLFLDAAY